jgi:hypothetical protein
MEFESNDFTIKYIPTKITDIIGCKDQIQQIKQWLDTFQYNKMELLKSNKKKTKKNKKIDIDTSIDEIGTDCVEIDTENNISYKANNTSSHSCLIIIGDHGTGKTCVTNTILSDMNYNIETINLSKIGSNKNIMENINKITKGSNIIDKLNSKNTIKNVLIIDELQSANSPVEKNYITTLLKINEEKWFYPIIFISNKKHSKLITTIKSNSNIVLFNQPSGTNLMNLLIKIATNEKMCIDNEKTGYKIVENSQYDYRRLLFCMQNLKLNYPNIQLTSKNIDEYYGLFKKKDLDIDIYRATARMMTKYEGIDECLKLYESDTVTIPLVMHQNFLKYIIQYDTKKKSFEIAQKISKSLSFSDLIADHIYSDQNWDIQNVFGFFSCVKPSYDMAKYGITSNEEYLKNKLDYPFDLNRTSIKYINKKNIINSNICLKNFKICDFIFVNKLLKKLIDDEEYEKCAEIFDGYNIKIENIESILKIDKINNTKVSLSSNIKKKISKFLNKK